MKCPQCRLVEMLVKNVKDNVVEYVCKKCGNTVKEEMKEDNQGVV